MSVKIDLGKTANGYKAENEEAQQTRYYDRMQDQMKNVCELLFHPKEKFDKENFYLAVCDYINNNDRLLYKFISNYVYSVCDNTKNDIKIDEIQKNLVDSVEFVMSHNASELAEKQGDKYEIDVHEKARKVVIKIQDHVDLAVQQYNTLKQTDEEYKRKFAIEFEETKDSITKEMSNQLVTLVGIFTAIAFVVFGGISSLDNIFQQGVSNVSLLKMMIIGTIWALCMTNLVYIFLFCVGKITKLSIKSSDNPKDNLVKKYPIIFWSNYLFLSLLIALSWTYYLYKNDFFNWLNNAAKKDSLFVAVTGFAIIGIIMWFGAWKLIELRRDK